MRAIIIDDEPGAREALQEMVALYTPEVRVLGMGCDVAEGASLIRKHNPDFVFLDVVMPKAHGFQLFEVLPTELPHVIFTTAHNQFALRAMKMAALDYLLKPIHPDELTRAISRVKRQRELDLAPKKLSIFRSNQHTRDPQIVLPTHDGHLVARLSEIIFFAAQKKFVKIVLAGNEEHHTLLSLSELEEMLAAFGFFRSHRSYLINLKRVQKLTRDQEIKLAGPYLLPLAQGKKSCFLNQFIAFGR